MSDAPLHPVLRTGPSGPLRGQVEAPGDKSISHRALMLGALAEGETRIEGLSEGRDLLITADALRALGAQAKRVGAGSWRVHGAAWHSPKVPIYCGNSGTTARLLMGAIASRNIIAKFAGDPSLHRRPMARVLDPLRAAGVEISAGDRLPVTISGRFLPGIAYASPIASAQVKSALLLAGLNVTGPVEVNEPAKSRDHTELMLAAFGCDVEVEGNRVRLGPNRRLTGTDLMIPGDPSSAAFALVAALLVPGSEVTVRGVLVNDTRTGLFDTLIEMGADLGFANRRQVGGEAVADVTARHSALRAVEVPADRVPRMIDEYPILAVAAAFAAGRTVMHGLAELRVKESDRLAAIVAGLTGCGVQAEVVGDSLIVDGGTVAGGVTVRTEWDHRIAMSFLVLGLAARAPVAVDQPVMIGTSFPGFARFMASLGAEIAA